MEIVLEWFGLEGTSKIMEFQTHAWTFGEGISEVQLGLFSAGSPWEQGYNPGTFIA